MFQQENSLLIKAVEKYGERHQTNKAIEECAEFIVAAEQYQAGRIPLEALQEEIADVMIMMEQMALVYGTLGVHLTKKKKLKRLEARL